MYIKLKQKQTEQFKTKQAVWGCCCLSACWSDKQRGPSSWPVLDRARLTSCVPDNLSDVLGFAPGALVREQRQAVDVCRRCRWMQRKQSAANLNPLPHGCTCKAGKPQHVTDNCITSTGPITVMVLHGFALLDVDWQLPGDYQINPHWSAFI